MIKEYFYSFSKFDYNANISPVPDIHQSIEFYIQVLTDKKKNNSELLMIFGETTYVNIK